jgi:hypothetical protein
MEQNYLNWSKTFGIKPNDEILDFIVQSHKGGYYFGVAIHFRENKNRQNKMTEPAFTLVTKNFGDTTEEGILAQFNDWLKSNFASKIYEVVEREKTSY